VKNFTLVVRARGAHVTAILVCDGCNGEESKWEGIAGTVHIDVDDINGDLAKHVCER
jgi:hypothetical protein